MAQILLKKLRVLFLIEIKVSEPCHPENFTILVLPTVPLVLSMLKKILLPGPFSAVFH